MDHTTCGKQTRTFALRKRRVTQVNRRIMLPVKLGPVSTKTVQMKMLQNVKENTRKQSNTKCTQRHQTSKNPRRKSFSLNAVYRKQTNA